MAPNSENCRLPLDDYSIELNDNQRTPETPHLPLFYAGRSRKRFLMLEKFRELGMEHETWEYDSTLDLVDSIHLTKERFNRHENKHDSNYNLRSAEKQLIKDTFNDQASLKAENNALDDRKKKTAVTTGRHIPPGNTTNVRAKAA
jgi:hypothetical protein